MDFDLLIFGGSVVSSEGLVLADVGVKDGKIVAVEPSLSGSANERLDATGLIVMPGAIDTQVHFREPGLEHKEDLATGSLAAMCGGVTSFLEMPNTNPTTTTREALDDKLARATGRCWSNFGFFFGASPSNVHLLAEAETWPGVPGIKVFAGSSTGDLLVKDDVHLRQVMSAVHGRVAFHSEDEDRNVARKALLSDTPHAREHPFLRDAESARLCTERILAIAEETDCAVHILHISTADELPLLADAKARGLKVTCEVTPQHLWFVAPECYDQLGTLAQMNPPLRSAEHNAALWTALEDGLFDVFGSDHAPHTLEEKAKPYPASPSGMPGVETLLPVLLTFVSQGRLTLEKLIEMLCERPASLYSMVGKGHIATGFDADISIVDPSETWVVDQSKLHSKCGWSPYDGVSLTGRVKTVVVGGTVSLREGEVSGVANGRVIEFGKR
ncbi:MAG TPA: dihydroorotase [Fimbriimonas sp.]|nr:dihydroorotase [Fimbriimonas sp.]